MKQKENKNQEFKIGQRVRVISGANAFKKEIHGYIATIVEVDKEYHIQPCIGVQKDEDKTEEDGVVYQIYNQENNPFNVEIIEDKNIPKYKIGDKVRVLGHTSVTWMNSHDFIKGTKVTIDSDIFDRGDNKITYMCKDSSCRRYSVRHIDLELIENITNKTNMKQVKKQFKNSFGIKSDSEIIIKAFIEAVKEIGWEHQISKSDINQLYFNGDEDLSYDKIDCLQQGCFWYCDQLGDSIIYNLPTQWDEAIKAASETESNKWKVGDWIGSSEHFGYITTVDKGFTNFYSFTYEKLDTVSTNALGFTKLTEEQVIERIIEKAKEKGFDIGKKVKSSFSSITYTITSWNIIKTDADSFAFKNGGCLFDLSTNKWSELLQEDIEISGYEAEVKGNRIKFGCKQFTQTELQSFLTLLEMSDEEMEATITINGMTITEELLIKLISKLK